jgi:hypothetical protein
MKKLLTTLALISVSTLLAWADRGDMDRLLTDINNHNTHLGQLLAAKDSAGIQKSAASLREDVKSLTRKSTGLAEKENSKLQARLTEVTEVTQKLEGAAAKNDFVAAQAQYQKLQTEVNQLREIAAAKGGSAAGGTLATATPATPTTTGDNWTDLKNHVRKLDEALKSKDAALVTRSTGYIREDLKAWTASRTGLAETEQKRTNSAEAEIVTLSGKIERNVEKGEWGDAREFHKKIDKLVTGLESPAKKKKKD